LAHFKNLKLGKRSSGSPGTLSRICSTRYFSLSSLTFLIECN